MENAKHTISAKFKEQNERRKREISDELLPKIKKDLEAAVEQGDLSENFDYHSAKDEYGKLESELVRIKEILLNSVVGPISYYKYKNLSNGVIYEVEIVDPIESDLFTEDAVIPISNQSGIAKQISGTKVGDKVAIRGKDGKNLYTVEILDFKVIE